MKIFYNFLVVMIWLLGFLSSNQISAQTTWAQPGADWIYNVGDGTSIGSTGVTEVMRIGDTLINGILCDVLSVHQMYQENWPTGQWQDYYLPNIYTCRINDTVFVMNGSSTFDILFVTNAQPGSNWITGQDIYHGCPGYTLFINSLQQVTLNGITMNKVTPDPFDWTPPYDNVYFHEPLYERFGSVFYIMPIPTCITDIWAGPLICYTDSSGFTFSPNPSLVCPVAISEIQSVSNNYMIVPNISSDYVNIKINFQPHQGGEVFEIIDQNGKLIKTFKNDQNNFPLNISCFAPGMYILKIKNRPEIRPVSFTKI